MLNYIVENINRPVPLEDELAYGLLARLAKLNGLPSVDELLRAIVTYPQWPANTPPLERIASIFGMKSIPFIQGHILPPSTRYLGISSIGKDIVEKAFNFMQTRMKTPINFLRWCPTCANEDLVSHGLSYWHRSHQLQGLDWCYLHQVPLRQATASFVMCEPHLLNHTSTPCISNEILKEELTYPALQRLQNILLIWVRTQPDLPRYALRRAIWGYRPRALSESNKKRLSLPSLDALMREIFPTTWLARYLMRHRAPTPLREHTYFSSALWTHDMDRIYLEPELIHALLFVCAFPETKTGLQRLTASVLRYMHAVSKKRTLVTPSFMHTEDKETFYSTGMGVLWAPQELNKEARITMYRYENGRSFYYKEDGDRRNVVT